MQQEENRKPAVERRNTPRSGATAQDVRVHVELEGSTYTGSYSVSCGTLTVTFEDLQKSTPVRGMSTLILARQLLRELVRERE